jgi:hypothetical protein
MKSSEISKFIGRMHYIFWILSILTRDSVGRTSVTYGQRNTNPLFGDLFGQDAIVPRQSKIPQVLYISKQLMVTRYPI